MADRSCGNCGRGYTYGNEEFTCMVCGAENHADGSYSYAADRDSIEEMQERINTFDDNERW